MVVLAGMGGLACDDAAKEPALPTAPSQDKAAATDKGDPQTPGKSGAKTDGGAASKPAPPEAGPAKVDPKTLLSDDGTYNYGNDALGALEDGLPDKDVLAKLGDPQSKDGREEEGATGDIVDVWSYPKQGIVLMMRSQTMTSAQSVSGITIKAPCEFKTKLGIGVGSTRAEVLAAYGAFKDPEFPTGPEQFIAGSVYGGTFFDFTDDKVASIFMGVGAE